MSCQQQGFQGDDITRDPAREALYDEVTMLAELDARSGIDPRQLTGELAELQDEYHAAYTEELAAIGREAG